MRSAGVVDSDCVPVDVAPLGTVMVAVSVRPAGMFVFSCAVTLNILFGWLVVMLYDVDAESGAGSNPGTASVTVIPAGLPTTEIVCAPSARPRATHTSAASSMHCANRAARDIRPRRAPSRASRHPSGAPVAGAGRTGS